MISQGADPPFACPTHVPELANAFAQDRTLKQTQVNKCKANLSKIMANDKEWLDQVLKAESKAGREIASLLKECEDLNKEAVRHAKDMRKVEMQAAEVCFKLARNEQYASAFCPTKLHYVH